MRCPKCSYLSYDDVERCRNCGYDFALATTPREPELPVPVDPDARATHVGADAAKAAGVDGHAAPG